MAFGYGFHRCIGSELAKLELRTAFRGLARRYPDLSLAVDPSHLRFRDLSIVYGVDALPVRLNIPAE
jgi:cytochrome P450